MIRLCGERESWCIGSTGGLWGSINLTWACLLARLRTESQVRLNVPGWVRPAPPIWSSMGGAGSSMYSRCPGLCVCVCVCEPNFLVLGCILQGSMRVCEGERKRVVHVLLFCNLVTDWAS